MKPKFTDGHRFPAGYTPSHETDIRKTFAKFKRQAEAAKREAAEVSAGPVLAKRSIGA